MDNLKKTGIYSIINILLLASKFLFAYNKTVKLIEVKTQSGYSLGQSQIANPNNCTYMLQNYLNEPKY